VTEDGKDFIDVEVEVDCSSGTYIRALARDLGEALGLGGHLVSLRRTNVGAYSVAQAQQLDGLTGENLVVMPISAAAQAQFAVRKLSEQDVTDLRHGKRLKPMGESSEPFAGIDANGNLVAMLTVSKDAVKSLVVFNDAEQK
jgi:tRNA pseudouridine55 synthase